jgi:hypothetical protein
MNVRGSSSLPFYSGEGRACGTRRHRRCHYVGTVQLRLEADDATVDMKDPLEDSAVKDVLVDIGS